MDGLKISKWCVSSVHVWLGHSGKWRLKICSKLLTTLICVPGFELVCTTPYQLCPLPGSSPALSWYAVLPTPIHEAQPTRQ